MTDPCAMRLFALLIGGALLVASRRYKNDDLLAGSGVAGWIIVIMIFASLCGGSQ